jgi:hypothetical protein
MNALDEFDNKYPITDIREDGSGMTVWTAPGIGTQYDVRGRVIGRIMCPYIPVNIVPVPKGQQWWIPAGVRRQEQISDYDRAMEIVE